jgi:hypothetical protein
MKCIAWWGHDLSRPADATTNEDGWAEFWAPQRGVCCFCSDLELPQVVIGGYAESVKIADIIRSIERCSAMSANIDSGPLRKWPLLFS